MLFCYLGPQCNSQVHTAKYRNKNYRVPEIKSYDSLKPYTVRLNNYINITVLRKVAVNIDIKFVEDPLLAEASKEEFELTTPQLGDFWCNCERISTIYHQQSLDGLGTIVIATTFIELTDGELVSTNPNIPTLFIVKI